MGIKTVQSAGIPTGRMVKMVVEQLNGAIIRAHVNKANQMRRLFLEQSLKVKCIIPKRSINESYFKKH